ncbi:MAG TPA: hypothetical protein VKE88_02975 [Candidatus Nanoarchaeia archaeon]|nr:hypothetical protein [Candidatus Nanoarchaeia archaeon]
MENEKQLKINLIGGGIAAALFLINYIKCGRSFDMCIPLLYSYVIISGLAIVLGFVSAKENENKLRSSVSGVIGIPLGILVAILFLEPAKLLNLKDVVVQFYVLLFVFIGGILDLIYSKIKNK